MLTHCPRGGGSSLYLQPKSSLYPRQTGLFKETSQNTWRGKKGTSPEYMKTAIHRWLLVSGPDASHSSWVTCFLTAAHLPSSLPLSHIASKWQDRTGSYGDWPSPQPCLLQDTILLPWKITVDANLLHFRQRVQAGGRKGPRGNNLNGDGCLLISTHGVQELLYLH